MQCSVEMSFKLGPLYIFIDRYSPWLQVARWSISLQVSTLLFQSSFPVIFFMLEILNNWFMLMLNWQSWLIYLSRSTLFSFLYYLVYRTKLSTPMNNYVILCVILLVPTETLQSHSVHKAKHSNGYVYTCIIVSRTHH